MPKQRKSQGDTECSRGVTPPGEARAPVDATFPDAGIPPPDMLATARSAIRLAPALRVGAHARARPVRGYSPIRRRDLTLPTFARASLGDARGRRPISSPVVSSRPGSASASRRRASAEGDGAGNRDDEEVSGQSSVAEAEANDADDADSYNVAEEMPDTIPYKSRDSADEDEDDDIKLPGAGGNAEAVKPAKGKDRACAFFPCSVLTCRLPVSSVALPHVVCLDLHASRSLFNRRLVVHLKRDVKSYVI